MENKPANSSPNDKPKAANKSQSSPPPNAAAPATDRTRFALCIDLESLSTLVRLDNLKLDLQRIAPFDDRRVLTRETVVAYLMDYILDEYDDGAGSSSVVERFKKELADIKRDDGADS